MSAKIRKKIFIYNQLSSEGHLPSSFSIVEILISIFQAEGCDPDPTWLSRLILSKGHASFAYYGFLASIGFMTEEEEKSICQNGSKLYGHLPHIIGDNRFTFGSGSLGHGLPYAIGKSFGDHNDKKYYCIVGDGEATKALSGKASYSLKSSKVIYPSLLIVISLRNGPYLLIVK